MHVTELVTCIFLLGVDI